jgi:hypothetical protein
MHLLRFGLELLDDQAVEQCRVRQPTAAVRLEQVACHGTARSFVGIDSDEECAPVCGADRSFGELAADVVGLVSVTAGVGDLIPDLLLARMIVCDRESLNCSSVMRSAA